VDYLEGEDHLCDLNFADDITLIVNSWSSMQQTTTALTVEASKVGLCSVHQSREVQSFKPLLIAMIG